MEIAAVDESASPGESVGRELERELLALGAPAYRLAARIAGSPEAAEDVVQQAYLAALQRLRSGPPPMEMRSWFLRAMANLAKLHLRQEARRRRKEAAVERSETSAGGTDPEIVILLRQAMAELDAKYRAPVALCCEEGLAQREAAIILDMPESTVSKYVNAGLELLRRSLERRGVTAGAAAILGGLVGGTAPAVPAGLAASLAELAATGTAAAESAAATFSVQATGGLALGWKIAAGAALAVILAAGGLDGWWQLRPATAPLPAGPSTASPPPSTITPRAYDAWTAFDELALKGGPRVVMFGGRQGTFLSVPAGLRFRPVDGRKLVEVVAASHELKVLWAREGRCAVLYPGASDEEWEGVRRGIASADSAVRREAVWRAGWLRDVRAVPLLINAAKAADAEAARQAAVGLRRATWDAVLTLDAAAEALLVADLDSSSRNARGDAAWALRNVGGEKALALLDKALADQDAYVRRRATSALGAMGEDGAVELLEKALQNPNPDVVAEAFDSLGRIGNKRALDLLEEGLDDPLSRVRLVAASALRQVRTARGPALIDRALASPDERVRASAMYSVGQRDAMWARKTIERALEDRDREVRLCALAQLGRLGDDRAVATLSKALDHEDCVFRWVAAYALGTSGNRKALGPLEKALGDEHQDVRLRAVAALGPWAESATDAADCEKALALAGKALADPSGDVRLRAAGILWAQRGPEAMALLGRALKDKDAGMRRAAASFLWRAGGKEELALLEKALAEEDADTRRDVMNVGLGRNMLIPANRALPLLERALDDQDAVVRRDAVTVLGSWGGSAALERVAKAVTDRDADVRSQAVSSLGHLGGERARDLLLARLAAEKDREVLATIGSALKLNFVNDPAVDKALKDLKLPEPPEQVPALRQQPAPPLKPEPAEVF